MGLISFYGTDDSDNTHERLAYIDSYIVEADHGSEAAGLRFYVAENDATLTQGLAIVGQASDAGEDQPISHLALCVVSRTARRAARWRGVIARPHAVPLR